MFDTKLIGSVIVALVVYFKFVAGMMSPTSGNQ